MNCQDLMLIEKEWGVPFGACGACETNIDATLITGGNSCLV